MNGRKFHIEKTIAQGTHSKIQLGRDSETLEQVVVKKINLNKYSPSTFYNETNILSILTPHKNIPKIYGHNKDKTYGYIVMEYLPFPTLSKFLKEKGALPEEQALNILKQLLNAIIHMTDHKIAHRDLKSENIIINPDTLVIKIIDFGLGKADLISSEDTDYHKIGTPLYMSPNMLNSNENKPYKIVASDMWSIGVIYWECLLGYQPYAHITTQKELLELQLKGTNFVHYSPTSQNLLESLLDINEDKRMTAQEAIGFMKQMGKVRFSSTDSNSSIPIDNTDPKIKFISYRFLNRKSSDDVLLFKENK